MERMTIATLLMMLGVGVATADDVTGYDLLYKTNKDEMVDVPIQFNNPLPSWLTGTLVRNGMGQFENGDRSFVHLFDGFGKFSSWRFYSNGSASFSTQFLQSNFYKESMASDSIATYLLFMGTEPPFNFFQLLEAMQKGLDNMNVNVFRIPKEGGGYEYMALNDYSKSYIFSPFDLSTGDKLTGALNSPHPSPLGSGFMDLLSTAHVVQEPGSDTVLTFVCSVALDPLEKSRLHLVRIKSRTDREVITTTELDKVPYMHSFSVTETHALILAQPFYVEMTCMMYKARPFECMQWEENSPSTLYVIELKTGKMEQLTMENTFTMHHVNAYNTEPGKMVMDICAYDNPSFVNTLLLTTLRDPARRNEINYQGLIIRYEVDLNQMKVKRVPLNTPTPAYIATMDMPTINENYRSQKYCFTYGVVPKTDNATLNRAAIVKRDVCGNGGDRTWIVPGHFPVEPVFVPNPEGKEEDDGVVLVAMLEGAVKKSYMAVLDAKSLNVMSTAYLPTVVPYNLHGRFFPEVI
ncbi:carotenoid isomerooxygenase-like [Babylonia areolata]|uniref:carotenoid isomerooxygenase-like n=1 Tax=Babylonia areolata TaxID=304850 RepID=UPI003FD0E7E7